MNLLCHKCNKELDEASFHKSSNKRGFSFYCKECRKAEWLERKKHLSELVFEDKCESCQKYAEVFEKLCKECLKKMGLKHCKKCNKLKLNLEFYQRKRICKSCLI